MDNPHKKYKPFSSIKIDNREWPSKIIESAPSWCSVDLRDGNQALIEPVSYTHLRAHETPEHLVCRLLLEKKKKNTSHTPVYIIR